MSKSAQNAASMTADRIGEQPSEHAGTTAFVAYSSSPTLISDTIERAVAEIERRFGKRQFYTWRENDILGHFVDDQVRENIDRHKFLVADISMRISVY